MRIDKAVKGITTHPSLPLSVTDQWCLTSPQSGIYTRLPSSAWTGMTVSGQSLDVIQSVFFSPATFSASCCHGCCMKSFSTGWCDGWRRGPWCLLPSWLPCRLSVATRGCCDGWRRGPWCLLPSWLPCRLSVATRGCCDGWRRGPQRLLPPWLPCRLLCGYKRLLWWVKERTSAPLAIMAAMQTSLWLQEAVVMGEGEALSASCRHGCHADFSVATRGCCDGWRRGPQRLLPSWLPCRLACGYKRLLCGLSLFKPFKRLFFIYYKLGFSLLLVWVKSVKQLSGFSDLKKIKSDWISKGGNEELHVSKAF